MLGQRGEEGIYAGCLQAGLAKEFYLVEQAIKEGTSMHCIKKIKSIFKCLIYSLIPTDKNSVLFVSFGGQYNDNPKYILTKLHDAAPYIKIYLAVSTRHNTADSIPVFVIPVVYGSFKYKFLLCRSGVIVSNGLEKCIQNCAPSRYIAKHISKYKRQLSIETWHGTPLKKILNDSPNWTPADSYIYLYDFVIAGCQYTESVLVRCVQSKPMPVLLTGTPRNDIFFKQNIEINSLKKKLGLPNKNRILLFAPTFRRNIDQSGVLMIETLQIKSILRLCGQRFGGEWVFVFRGHPLVYASVRTLISQSNISIIDGNKGDDMAEYLACTDILLTDYSSSMFDFALTGRPCFLFAPDREHYEKKERGFYLDYDSLPFPISYTNEQFIESIKAFDEATYQQKVEKFLEDIGNVEDGKASERIAKCIVHFMQTGEKKLETVSYPPKV